MKVPGTESVFWDWKEGVAFVRFLVGEHPTDDDYRTAIEKGTRFKVGEIRSVQTIAELPDALR